MQTIKRDLGLLLYSDVGQVHNRDDGVSSHRVIAHSKVADRLSRCPEKATIFRGCASRAPGQPGTRVQPRKCTALDILESLLRCIPV